MKSNILTEKILIVDSNIDYAKFIQNALKKDGYLCYIAVSYEEAINLTYEKNSRLHYCRLYASFWRSFQISGKNKRG